MHKNQSLPNFLCAGAAKCGTTSLHAILAEHPQIFLPQRKEIHFFENNGNYSKGLDWYSKYFKNANEKKVIGEITADYMFFDYVPERIIEALGKNIKIIFMLRNPVDRSYSEYLFNVRRGFFKGTFEEAIQNEKKYDPNIFENRYYVHIYRSMYSIHLSRMMKFFHRDNMKFILFEEDFVKNKERMFTDLFEFLEISYADLRLHQTFKPSYTPRIQWVQNLVYQPNIFKSMAKNLLPSYKIKTKIKDQLLPLFNCSKQEVEKIDASLKHKLIKDYFYEEINKTQDLIKRDLSIWNS